MLAAWYIDVWLAIRECTLTERRDERCPAMAPISWQILLGITCQVLLVVRNEILRDVTKLPPILGIKNL